MVSIAAEAVFLASETINPSLELGTFEALWANNKISSFKQLRDKLDKTQGNLLSTLIDNTTARNFYLETIKCLQKAGIKNFGVRIEGTIDYPEKLYDATHSLPLLYYQGYWDLVFTRGVSVVGTRKASEDALKRTRKLVKALVKENFTIYSGLAAGIDTVAHQTAIENNGQTVAVIGTPLWMKYPKENASLQNAIAENYLLISQVPIVCYKNKNINFTRMFFPERNKTMSALTEATIIVEAGNTSGTLIQAKAALQQGRKVFILNSNFENSKLSWPYKLEQAGAIRVYNIDDILQGLLSAKL